MKTVAIAAERRYNREKVEKELTAMTVIEAMESIGADGEGTLKRFSGNMMLVDKFVKKFPQDETYSKLRDAVDAGREADLEALAHTLKGASANLGFTALSAKCAAMVDRMRGRNTQDIGALMQAITEEYRRVSEAIAKIG